MGWREQLKPAEFRGVPFDVLLTDGQLGRRAALHEYPGRDEPWVEDLGRRARVLTIDAVVIGADYMARRDALINALEEAGAGKLKHPTLGEMQVTLTDCRMSESTAEGGMARFGLVFVEAGAPAWPKHVGSTPDQVAAKAELTVEEIMADFEFSMSTAGQPDFVASSATSILGGMADQVKVAAATVQAALEPLADLQRQVDAFNADLATLVYTPYDLASGVVDMVQQLVRGVAQEPVAALDVAKRLWRFGNLDVTVAGVSAKRAVELNNQVVIARLVRGAALCEGARAAASLTFDSFDQAAKLRDELAEALDELLMATANDDAFDALRALRAAVVADITARGADLSRLVRFTPAGTMPALLLAQQFYGDGSRGDEVLSRNQAVIGHPLFVRGGMALEVLADA